MESTYGSVGKGMHEQYSYCRNVAHISVILWGYVLIWYSCGMCDVIAEEQPKIETGFLCEIELGYGRLLQNQGCRRGHRD